MIDFDKINVSVYSSVSDTVGKTKTLADWLVPSESTERLVKKIREKDLSQEERKKLKEKLPCCTISACFSGKRSSSSPYRKTGFICIDIDGKDNPDHDVRELKELASGIMQVCYCAYSASRTGVYAIIPLKEPERHAESFEALSRLFEETRGLKVDQSCKDITRLRFASLDEYPHWNLNAEPFWLPPSDSPKTEEANEPKFYASFQDSLTRVEAYVEAIEKLGADIAPSRAEWIRVGMALHTLGKEGKSLFERVSRLWSGTYSQKALDQAWSSFKNDDKANAITLGTFFDMCAKAGISIHRQESDPFAMLTPTELPPDPDPYKDEDDEV